MITKTTSERPSGVHKKPFIPVPFFEGIARSVRNTWKGEAPSTHPTAVQLIPELDRKFTRNHNCINSLRQSLWGRRVIDLGAGNMESMISIAQLVGSMGASEYIAVDNFVEYSGAARMLKAYLRDSHPKMRFKALNEDMLLFISKLEDASANVVVNGLVHDALVGEGSMILADQYMAELAAEIARVVPPGGVAFGVSSPTIQKLRFQGFVSDVDKPGYILYKRERRPE